VIDLIVDRLVVDTCLLLGDEMKINKRLISSVLSSSILIQNDAVSNSAPR
jgi:hypothetical protein